MSVGASDASKREIVACETPARSARSAWLNLSPLRLSAIWIPMPSIHESYTDESFMSIHSCEYSQLFLNIGQRGKWGSGVIRPSIRRGGIPIWVAPIGSPLSSHTYRGGAVFFS